MVRAVLGFPESFWRRTSASRVRNARGARMAILAGGARGAIRWKIRSVSAGLRRHVWLGAPFCRQRGILVAYGVCSRAAAEPIPRHGLGLYRFRAEEISLTFLADRANVLSRGDGLPDARGEAFET